MAVIDNEELMKEWNWEKNNELGFFPNEINIGDKRHVWWKCEKGHDWTTTCGEKFYQHVQCPYCTGRKVLAGYNDLATIYPDIASEWHPTKNEDLKSSDFTYKTQRKVWWLCPNCGYEWRTSIYERTIHHTGCPNCKSGLSTSFPEQAIYFYVKKLYPNATNRYKEIFSNGSELDIYIPEIKIGIEYDGKFFHDTKNKKELSREQEKFKICHEHGIKLIRVCEKMNEETPKIPNQTFDMAIGLPTGKTKDIRLTYMLQILLDELDPVSNPMTRNVTYCHSRIDINLERDRNEILSYLTDLGDKSLESLYPEIANEWHKTKNGNIKPSQISPGSNTKFWWKCKYCGNEWQDTPNKLTSRVYDGCPSCAWQKSGKKFSKNYLESHQSLAEVNPDLASQWHPTKNGNITPKDVPSKSPKYYWWVCPDCGYEWKASIECRMQNHVYNCPRCAGRIATPGKNDFATLHPDLLNQWNYEKNRDLKPNEILTGTSKHVWWKCSKCGYEWIASPRYIVKINGGGCPRCAGRIPFIGVNDFGTLHPELLNDWDFTKNIGINPYELCEKSSKKVWWKCSLCDYEWQATLADRSNGKGCPSCGHKKSMQKRWHPELF